jgi:hypothetical protein
LIDQSQSLIPEYHRLVARHAERCAAARELHGNVLVASGENKAVLLSPYLDKIVVHFDPTGKTLTVCKMVRAELHAKDADAPVKVVEEGELTKLFREYNGRRKGKTNRWSAERRAKQSVPWTAERRAKHSTFWTPERRAEHSARWTPERRARQAEHQKAIRRKSSD